ncbi:MAG: A24 family peptidase [Proteobacteria bacterium]|nr:A24 family peptidase [Pseudomonadota bacterium]
MVTGGWWLVLVAGKNLRSQAPTTNTSHQHEPPATMIIINILLILIAVYCAAMMAVWDVRARIIPDVFLFPFLLAGLLLCDQLPWMPGGFAESALAGAIGYGVGFALNIIFKWIGSKKEKKNNRISRPTTNDQRPATSDQRPTTSDQRPTTSDPIGMGDIKLLAAGGIWMGITGLSIALIAACVFGGIWGMLRRQRYVPLAPFFFAGMGVAIAVLIVTE